MERKRFIVSPLGCHMTNSSKKTYISVWENQVNFFSTFVPTTKIFSKDKLERDVSLQGTN